MTPRCTNGVEYTKSLRESQRSNNIKRQEKKKKLLVMASSVKRKSLFDFSLDKPPSHKYSCSDSS